MAQQNLRVTKFGRTQVHAPVKGTNKFIVYAAGEIIPAGTFPEKHYQMLLNEGICVETKDDPTDKKPVAVADIEKSAEPAAGSRKGKFDINPSKMAKMTLADLNATAQKIDADLKPFDTKEEAIAVLSSDFQG